MRERVVRFAPINLLFWVSWFAYAVFLLVAPHVFTSNLGLTILCQIGTITIATLSYNMLLGETGMLSFGHAVYSGLGAFVAVHTMNLVSNGGFFVPTSLIPLVGGVGGAIFGVLFGYVSTKRSGTTFAMITLGIGELVASMALTFPEFFGGEAGVSTDRVMGNPVLGITYGPQIQVYYLIAFWLFVCTIGMYAFARTPLGRMANAVRENPERAAFIGYNTHMVRFLVILVASFFAGISGGLSAINFELVTAENVGAYASGSLLLFTFLGGVGTFIGPIIGAVIAVFSQALLSELTPAWLLYLGLFFMIFVMYAPGGIASLLLMNMRVLQHRLMKPLLAPYAVLAAATAVLFVGAGAVIELVYARQLGAGNGNIIRIFGVNADITSPTSWVVACAVAVVGGLLFRLAARRFKGHWDGVQTQIAERTGAGT